MTDDVDAEADLALAEKAIKNNYRRFYRVNDAIMKETRPVDAITVDISDFDLLWTATRALERILDDFPEAAEYVKTCSLMEVTDDEPLRIDPNPQFVFND